MSSLLSQYALLSLFPLAMAYAAASDLLTMTIPNKLVLAMLAGFLLLAPAVGMSWQTFAMHLAAGGIVLAVCFVFFALRWIGGGDAKFAAAAALWLGWNNVLEFTLTAALFGGALTLLLLSFRASPLPAFINQAWVQRLYDRKTGVPYGIALAAAGLVTYPGTIWMALGQ